MVAIVLSLVGLYGLDGSLRVGRRLRRRFVLGVPWGSVLTVALVLSVYLFVQGGLARPYSPVVLPFRAWSYTYPLGMIAAAFAHVGQGHLIGNLVGTVVFAPIAEYYLGHYPRERGTQAFSSLSTNPFARLLAVPAAAIVVGLFTSLFSLGPVIGFSGVVFAFAGFAFVTRPLTALGGLVAGRILDLVVTTLRNPLVVAEAKSRFITPWWAQVAIQGHAIGLLAGVLVGSAILWWRDDYPDPVWLWFGVLSYTVYRWLWAVYVPQSGSQFVMFRWVGVAALFVFALVITASLAPTDRSLVSRIELSRRDVGVGIVLATLVVFSAIAVPYNLGVTDPRQPGDRTVEVRDYRVGYAENVLNQYAASVRIPFAEEQTRINTSGVVVTSDRRGIWYVAIRKGRLAHDGEATVRLGGLGWRESVTANRTGWSVLGNETVYRVYLRPEGENRTLAFTSPPSTASPTIAGRNVTIRPDNQTFSLAVTRGNRTVGTVPVPANGTVAAAGGLAFERNRSKLFVEHGDTRVQIATKRDGKRERNG